MNKGNIKMDELKKGWVTAAEVHAHLESVLKCPIKSDFKVITGANPFDVYVRMRIAIEDKYALDTTGANSYVDQVLAANCSELPLRDSIYKKLLKFMYPQDVNDLRQFILNQNPQKLLNKGIYGANLKELLDNATPHHSAKYSEIAVYVMPEAIIRDMVVDPADDDDVDFFIDLVTNDPTNGVRWRACTVKYVAKTIMTTHDDATIQKIYESL
jgi:hypothetical protein